MVPMQYRAVGLKTQGEALRTRPFKGHSVKAPYGDYWSLEEPLTGEWMYFSPSEVVDLGGWTDPCEFHLSDPHQVVSWEAYAKHVLGQILRQHDLVDRLAKLGIDRFEKEHYASKRSSFKTGLFLNYDELSLLLSAHEEPSK